MSRRALLLAAFIAAALAAIVAGLVVLGSPAAKREHRLDRQRVDDLRGIALAIDRRWQETSTLPDDLESFAGLREVGIAWRDPVSDVPYEYRVEGPGHYALCATFARATAEEPQQRYDAPRPFWRHPAGRHCYAIMDAGTGDQAR